MGVSARARTRLEPYLASTQPSETGWYDSFCPFHIDKHRSAGVNFTEGVFSCRKSCGTMSLSALMDRLDAMDAADESYGESNVVDINTGKPKSEPATDEDAKLWHKKLLADEDLLRKFTKKRGIKKRTIRKFRIGYSYEQRAYTIPIYSADGKLLNLRFYRFDSDGSKMWSWGGMSASEIYPEQNLKLSDDIIIAEGEWDALMATQKGYAAVTGTTGANQWQSKWNDKFVGKNVYICYDRDKAGDVGAEKVADNLRAVAASVHIVKLPLDWTETHGADITDFFKKQKGTTEEFSALLGLAEGEVNPFTREPLAVSVSESFNENLAGQPMLLEATVSGKLRERYLVPKKASVSCNQNAGKICNGCPMAEAGGYMQVEIAKWDPAILAMRDSTESQIHEEIRKAKDIHKCGRYKVEPKEQYTIEIMQARTSIEAARKEGDNGSRMIAMVGEYATEPNRTYKITGTSYASPKDAISVFQAWNIDRVESSLDNFKLTDAQAEALSVFKVPRGSNPSSHMWRIAEDLAANVTHIKGRTDLHVAMDLVWHSALGFTFAGRPEPRGWVELLVVGDARTGKSEVASNLAAHYGVGQLVSCEAASIPGLLGAVKQMPGRNGSWALEWGAIPLNDRRLIVMDEAGGLSHDQIGQLSSIRSSGIAEIIKAETERTNARTRLLWLSNPRNNVHGMAGYMHGVDSIAPLIGNQEDIARFDLAMTVAANDVDLQTINTRLGTVIPHVFTADLCQLLVIWIWSRRPEQIVWSRRAEDLVFDYALDLGDKYVSEPPLVQGQNIRTKIARMAVSVAGRVFSTDETHDLILVKPAHVKTAVDFLQSQYDKGSFGYLDISRNAKEEARYAVAAMDEIAEYLDSKPGLARNLRKLGGVFRAKQLEEVMDWRPEETKATINRLSSLGMIRSNEFDYTATPVFNEVLRNYREAMRSVNVKK